METSAESTKAMYALSRAKAQLIIEQPFYASLLCNMPFVEDPSVPTMAVDGKNVYFNSEFVNKLSVNELKFVECHEVMHCVFQHITRRGARNPVKWNKAGDYIINDILVADQVGQMPAQGLYNQSLVKAGDYSTDKVYNLLPDDDSNGDGHGGPGGDALDEVRDGNPADAAQTEQEWKIRAVQAAMAAKMQGKMSAGIKRLLGDIVEPKVKWQDALRRFVSKQSKTDRSFSRPNRRFIQQGLYLPALSGEALGKLAIAVDCSGSISAKVLNEFAAEIKNIKELCRPSSIEVLYFDSEVSHTETYMPEDALDIKPHGGGGTEIAPVITAVNAMDEAPAALVILTDLYLDDFHVVPDCPTLWVSNGRQEAPWGEVLDMR
jgi:predicted metal-dependent peptidase